MTSANRIEKDSLGEHALPGDALYGINTFRGVQNFPIAGRTLGECTPLVKSLAQVKQAAALANRDIGALDEERADAIIQACQRMIAGHYNADLRCDLLEGSGGTSLNMNANEVLTNAALGLLGCQSGDYTCLHPNDHLNLSQSTNDVVSTAIKLAVFEVTESLINQLSWLADALSAKRNEFADVLRLGRTCLQDAQPMTLGQAFGGYESVVRRHREQLQHRCRDLLSVPLGGTAIGTGLGARRGYRDVVCRYLAELVGQDVTSEANTFDGMQNMDSCARLSAELRNTGNSLWKLGNDLIILSSGPAGGLGELILPAVQAGSSIMPGKINPVIPMTACQVSLAVHGNDAAVSLAAQQGLLDLNHYEIVIVDRLLDSVSMLDGAVATLTENCIVDLRANEERSLANLMNSGALATVLIPMLGYGRVTELVKEADQKNRRFVDLIIASGYLDEAQITQALREAALSPEHMTSMA